MRASLLAVHAAEVDELEAGTTASHATSAAAAALAAAHGRQRAVLDRYGSALDAM